jgi:hypothetical protein
MEAFLQALTEDRRCMDCKSEVEAFEGAITFSGQIPYTELTGHLCQACWERREELRQWRAQKT